MKKELENFEQLSKFQQDLINLILRCDEENLKKLRKAYPKLVNKLRGKEIKNETLNN